MKDSFESDVPKAETLPGFAFNPLPTQRYTAGENEESFFVVFALR